MKKHYSYFKPLILFIVIDTLLSLNLFCQPGPFYTATGVASSILKVNSTSLQTHITRYYGDTLVVSYNKYGDNKGISITNLDTNAINGPFAFYKLPGNIEITDMVILGSTCYFCGHYSTPSDAGVPRGLLGRFNVPTLYRNGLGSIDTMGFPAIGRFVQLDAVECNGHTYIATVVKPIRTLTPYVLFLHTSYPAYSVWNYVIAAPTSTTVTDFHDIKFCKEDKTFTIAGTNRFIDTTIITTTDQIVNAIANPYFGHNIYHLLAPISISLTYPHNILLAKYEKYNYLLADAKGCSHSNIQYAYLLKLFSSSPNANWKIPKQNNTLLTDALVADKGGWVYYTQGGEIFAHTTTTTSSGYSTFYGLHDPHIYLSLDAMRDTTIIFGGHDYSNQPIIALQEITSSNSCIENEQYISSNPAIYYKYGEKDFLKQVEACENIWIPCSVSVEAFHKTQLCKKVYNRIKEWE